MPDLRPVNWLVRRSESLVASGPMCYSARMSNLAEIEAAADALSPEQKQELMLFLGARLRAQRCRMPESRKFSREQMDAWIAEDEADMQRFREGMFL
jgi:hypothetical protein